MEAWVTGKIKRWLEFDWNWQGAIVGLVLLGLLAGDLALFGQTVSGYVGVVLVVLLWCSNQRVLAGLV